MTIEQQALDLVKENEALKAQVNNLLKACKLYGDFSTHTDFTLLDEADTIVIMTPEQCLNSVKADAIGNAAQRFNYEYDGLMDASSIESFFDDIVIKLRNNNG